MSARLARIPGTRIALGVAVLGVAMLGAAPPNVRSAAGVAVLSVPVQPDVRSAAGVAATRGRPTVSTRATPVPPPGVPTGAGDRPASPPGAAAAGSRRSAAPPAGAGRPVAGAGYAWPLLPPPAVLTPFGAPDDPFGPGHRGVDLAGVVGQPVLAARAGTVVFAGPVGGLGVVSVQHDDGLRTTYEPIVPAVRAGATVAAGDVVGTLTAGHRGCPSVCLHWGVRRDRLDYLDPLVLLLPPHVRLLPVPELWPDG